MPKFSKALLAWMKHNIGNMEALKSLIIGETYTVSGRTIDGVKGEGGHTALHSAVLAEKTQIVKFLLESGCQPRTLSSNWQTALHDAILLGNHDIVMLLLEFGAPNVCLSTNAIGELPLHTAAKLFTQPQGEKIFWDILICSGLEELNRLTPSGKSVLHMAAIENYTKMIRILLDPSRNGPRAFVNVASTDGTTPLHMAIAKGHTRATQVLLKHGADPNATNFFGETPLHFACQCSSDRCAESILSIDTLWRKGDSKRPVEDIPTSPRSSPKLKDSNHWRLVVVEAKDFGLNLPLHYAAGWIPNYSRKMGDSKQEEVFGPFVTSPPSEPAPGSTSSSSASSSSVPSSTKIRRSPQNADSETSEASSSNAHLTAPSPSNAASGASTSQISSKSGASTPLANATTSSSSLRSSSAKASAPSIRMRSLSLKLIEQMLDLEMRHSRHPLYRKYAFSIVTPNRAGYTPMQIAEENQDVELMDLFKEYAPPECEIPDSSEFLSIQLASDIHLECLAHDQPSGRKLARKLVGKSKAKYVALLGDIGIAVRPYYKDFLIRLSKRYTNVFVLYGNHEFYHSTTSEALETIETVTKEYPNVLWLRAGHAFEVEGVKIVGDTLWSHLAEDEIEAVGYHLSDYRHIEIEDSNATGGKRKLTTADTQAWHQEQLAFIKQEIQKSKKKNQPVVVMTHHAPLMRLGVTNPGLWESSESEVNSAFCTDLSSLLGSPVVAWLYGHTHWNHNMIINDTLIAANQGGYIFGETPTLPTNYDPKFTIKVLKQLPTGRKWAPSLTPNLH
jgi:predicted phosphohydrolase